MEAVVIENVGPIEGTFQFELDGPGLYELSGGSGVGKSTVITALGLLAGHKVDLTLHDGAISGSVSGMGVVAPVGSKKRKKGDFEFNVLDSAKFDLCDLIDPDGKTQATRDSVRIKALAAMSGLEITATDLGIDPNEIEPSSDPILLASRAKAQLDKKARDLESEAEFQFGKAKGLISKTQDLDLAAECDAELLINDMQAKVTQVAELRKSQDQYRETMKSAAHAQDALERIESSGESLEAIQVKYDAKEKEVSGIADALRELKKSHDDAIIAMDELQDRLEERGKLEKAIVEYKAILVEAGKLSEVTDTEISVAVEAKDLAIDAMKTGELVREAKRAKTEANQLTDSSRELLKQAEELRERGRSIYDTLAAKLELDHIQVESIDGVLTLTVDHPIRGKTRYDQVNGLSDGERVMFALKELLHRYGDDRPGLMAIPQRIYQDLQPAARHELAAYAVEQNLYLVGAQVTDGQLEITKM